MVRTSTILSRRLLLIAALMTMAPAVAEAQIYAWRDGAGNLVLSDKPKDPSAKTYAVAAAPKVGVGGSLREQGRRIPGHEASHDQSDAPTTT